MGIVIAFLMAFSVFTTAVDDTSATNGETTTINNNGGGFGTNNIGAEDWEGG